MDKYIEYEKKCLKKFISKIENWFLECKYNPKYKYCQIHSLIFSYNIYDLSS